VLIGYAIDIFGGGGITDTAKTYSRADLAAAHPFLRRLGIFVFILGIRLSI